MLLAKRVAIVTGASGALGKAIATALAAAGAAGGEALALQADIATADGAEALVKATVEAYGKVDILVNNAGITRDGLLMRMKEDDWDAVLDTNLKGVFLCTKAVTRTMLKARYGRIINIGSVSGLVGVAGQANYSAAKAGMIGFTRATARELGSRGITVNCVAPGAIEAGLLLELNEEQRTAYLKQIPLERFGTPEDVASAVLFLAGPGADYVTGQTLPVDGGLTMQ
ncbi:MAG: 3-oxoacyl-(acyl-carrier protein) reductase [Symbiobacteriaceae bacterium]|nr:3-oxoacyl-(acyl-carrier protein) reductase [Symbiobacteriaceae bacterium]